MIDVPAEVLLIDFADDLALLATARTSDALSGIVNPTLEAIEVLTRNHELHLAHQKTEAIKLIKKQSYITRQK